MPLVNVLAFRSNIFVFYFRSGHLSVLLTVSAVPGVLYFVPAMATIQCSVSILILNNSNT